MTGPLLAARLAGAIALLLAAVAVLLATTGPGRAAREPVRASSAPREDAALRLDRHGRFPREAIPTVDRAARTMRVGGMTPSRIRLRCPAATVTLGTWCLDRDVRGRGTYPEAARACIARGGVVPTAGELVGAAPRVRLSSRADDRPGSALVAGDGATDLRELTSTTITTRTGSAAAGGPGTPLPTSLQYVTVFDNRDHGGFAGAVPVGEPERFRCAYRRRQLGPATPPTPTLVSVAARRGPRITVRADLPRAGLVRATATTTGRRPVVVAFGAARLAAGRRTVRLAPTRAGRRALGRGRRTAVVRLTLRRSDGLTGAASRRTRVAAR